MVLCTFYKVYKLIAVSNDDMMTNNRRPNILYIIIAYYDFLKFLLPMLEAKLEDNNDYLKHCYIYKISNSD